MSKIPISGIYVLFFESDDAQFYVGKSTNILSRYSSHISKLNCGTHANSKLYSAFISNNKVAPSLFILELVDISDNIKLAKREIYWIKELDSFSSGFNNSYGGEGYSGEYSVLLLKDTDNYINFVKILANTPNITIKEAALLADISYDSARDICAKKTGTWIQKYVPEEYLKIISCTGSRSTKTEPDHKYEQALRLLGEGSLNMKMISDKLEISYQIVRSIACGSTHKYLKDKYPEAYEIMLNRKRGNGSNKYLIS